jgi:hypothetical protein
MYAHTYLLQLVAEERTREMRSTAARARLAREARLGRAHRTRLAARHAAATESRRGLLRAIPQLREPQDVMARRAA